MDLSASTIAATMMEQQLLGGEPVVQFDSFATAAFHPKVIGNLLDFGLGRLTMRSTGWTLTVTFILGGDPAALRGPWCGDGRVGSRHAARDELQP